MNQTLNERYTRTQNSPVNDKLICCPARLSSSRFLKKVATNTLWPLLYQPARSRLCKSW